MATTTLLRAKARTIENLVVSIVAGGFVVAFVVWGILLWIVHNS